jgi:AraC-like DNA-binding protein
LGIIGLKDGAKESVMGEHLLFNDKFFIAVNKPASPLHYYFEFDSRSGNIMDFPHFHRFYEILILLEGAGAHIIEGEYYPLNKYDIVLLSPHVLHKTEYPPDIVHRRLMIQFTIPPKAANDPSGVPMNCLFSLFKAKIPIYRLPEEGRKRTLELLDEIFTIKMRQPALTDLLIHLKFLEFLCSLYNFQNQNLYMRELHTDSSVQRIYNLTSYIHSNYSRPFSLEKLSKMIYLSPYYLSHLFKRVTGFTVVRYIQMIRIRNAQQLLLSTKMKVSKIAEQCGFTSFSQFNRIFRKFCKISPLAFRREFSGRENPPILLPLVLSEFPH